MDWHNAQWHSLDGVKVEQSTAIRETYTVVCLNRRHATYHEILLSLLTLQRYCAGLEKK